MYGFVEQLLHYFNRPHVVPPTAPVGGPAAWIGKNVAPSSAWREQLSSAHVKEIECAVKAARVPGRCTGELAVEDFPLPTLRPCIDRWRDELVNGRGFVLVSGFPVEAWSHVEAEVAFWGLGLHLGIPGAQNEGGDLLGHVTDLSAAREHADERLYRTNKPIRFHCDAADAVGLLCLSTSANGGISRLVSSVTVFDHLFVNRPELAARLFEPFLLDARRPGGAGTQYTAVQPCTFDGTRLRTFMHLDYFRSVERHAGVTLDALARAALDAWEAFAERADVRLDMQLRRGDLQLVSNHTVVHARTSYVDDPSSPRHLLRLWLSLV